MHDDVPFHQNDACHACGDGLPNVHGDDDHRHHYHDGNVHDC